MTRTRIIVAALAALALAAPAASADPHAIDAHNRAVQNTQGLRSADAREAAVQAELRARGRDGVQTGSLAGTTAATTRALAQERAYSTSGARAPAETPPAPVESQPAPVADGDDGPSWPLIAIGLAGVALLFGAAVALVARPRRARVTA